MIALFMAKIFKFLSLKKNKEPNNNRLLRHKKLKVKTFVYHKNKH